MIIDGIHYSENCLCEGCKQAGNKRYIGGGVYNESRLKVNGKRK